MHNVAFALPAILLLLLFGACEKQGAGMNQKTMSVEDSNANNVSEGDDTLRIEKVLDGRYSVADVDGDRLIDTVQLHRLIFHSGSNVVGEMTEMQFSAPVPDLVDSTSTGGVAVGVGDLDGNGTEEIAFLRDWSTSCWIGLMVYGLEDNQWKAFGGGSYYRCNDGAYEPDSIAARVRKIRDGVFEVISDSLGDNLVRTASQFSIGISSTRKNGKQ